MTKTLSLPSGKTATLRKGRGFDLLQAQQKAKTSEEIPYALIAELAEIDGQKLVYEDILELDLEDVIALQAEISGKLTEAKAIEIKEDTPTEKETQQIPEPEPQLPEPEPEPEPQPASVYRDGVYQGTGMGFEGPITVSVTIQGDRIVSVDVVSQSEDEPFWSDAKAVLGRILSVQSPNVDAVSEATSSSHGIMDGVRQALDSARN